ncbi:hypothetical protein [Helicobacter ganmani]|uniref:hypothetical protein n=1 Tax=Helicobacter ganmani TaxID=60246 RepID=UPI003A8AF15C
MNANFARLDSKTIAKICRTLIALTLLAYLVDKILISSPSFHRLEPFKNGEYFPILTDFNIFIIAFVSFFFIFALFYECFYNLKEKIKTKILRYIYMALAILMGIICVVGIFISIFEEPNRLRSSLELSVFPAIVILLMFVFMFIDKILCKARGQ